MDKVVQLIAKNPGIKIEIGGHTDNVGTNDYNLTLSENRAEAVYDYLTKHGISPSQLIYKGYGEHVPVDTNDTDKGRANNRRTEFKIIEL